MSKENLHCKVCRDGGQFDDSLRREECPDFFTQSFFRSRDAAKSTRDYFRYCSECKVENWGFEVGKEIPQRSASLQHEVVAV